MSKSRLEKFLYALYSLDSSDLPTPLSRIEELYNCWVTGEEAPAFKPLSRVEKYLMAILGVYDVELLPNPLSRVEVLLYKLATGDDNLDDIKSFLSEHEELLAEIIRNRGAGGNIDIEYVLYSLSTEHNTLYNTAEKPVKSAILNGETLVNLIDNQMYTFTQAGSIEKDGEYVTITSAKETSTNVMIGITLKQPLEANTLYTLIYLDRGLAPKIILRDVDNATIFLQVKNTGIKTFTTKENSTKNLTLYYCDVSVGQKYKHTNNVMIIKGDVSNLTFNNYFEGMQSVKMPVLTTYGDNIFDNNNIIVGSYYGYDGKIVSNSTSILSTTYISIEPNAQLISNISRSSYQIVEYDSNKNFITRQNAIPNNPTTLSSNTRYVRFSFYDCGTDFNCYVRKGLIKPLVYEPFKSNILTVNEEVELRGIGDVKDELDLLTGELTERIGEMVLDGSENWISNKETETHISYYLNIASNMKPQFNAIANSLPTFIWGNVEELTKECFWSFPSSYGIIVLKAECPTIEDFKQKLSNNPVLFQYELNESTVKTVDLSVVDQDGNNTKLSTFNDITHVTLSSEVLIPEAELEVATKNEEVLNTMSLEMDDISTTQNTLEETSDAQSENVDATMIATTEIYEGLL